MRFSTSLVLFAIYSLILLTIVIIPGHRSTFLSLADAAKTVEEDLPYPTIEELDDEDENIPQETKIDWEKVEDTFTIVKELVKHRAKSTWVQGLKGLISRLEMLLPDEEGNNKQGESTASTGKSNTAQNKAKSQKNKPKPTTGTKDSQSSSSTEVKKKALEYLKQLRDLLKTVGGSNRDPTIDTNGLFTGSAIEDIIESDLFSWFGGFENVFSNLDLTQIFLKLPELGEYLKGLMEEDSESEGTTNEDDTTHAKGTRRTEGQDAEERSKKGDGSRKGKKKSKTKPADTLGTFSKLGETLLAGQQDNLKDVASTVSGVWDTVKSVGDNVLKDVLYDENNELKPELKNLKNTVQQGAKQAMKHGKRAAKKLKKQYFG